MDANSYNDLAIDAHIKSLGDEAEKEAADEKLYGLIEETIKDALFEDYGHVIDIEGEAEAKLVDFISQFMDELEASE